MNRESINIRDIAHQIYEIFIFLLWQLFWLRDFESILAKHCDRPMQVSTIMTGFRFDHVRYKWSLWRSIQVPSNEQANELIHPRDDLLVRIRHGISDESRFLPGGSRKYFDIDYRLLIQFAFRLDLINANILGDIPNGLRRVGENSPSLLYCFQSISQIYLMSFGWIPS